MGKSVCAVVVLVLVVVVGLLGEGVQYAEADLCGTVRNNVLGCFGYVTKIAPTPSASCCTGVKQLDAMANSVTARRAICTCLQNNAKMFTVIDKQRVASLGSQCKATRSFSLSDNCNTIP